MFIYVAISLILGCFFMIKTLVEMTHDIDVHQSHLLQKTGVKVILSTCLHLKAILIYRSHVT